DFLLRLHVTGEMHGDIGSLARRSGNIAPANHLLRDHVPETVMRGLVRDRPFRLGVALGVRERTIFRRVRPLRYVRLDIRRACACCEQKEGCEQSGPSSHMRLLMVGEDSSGVWPPPLLTFGEVGPWSSRCYPVAGPVASGISQGEAPWNPSTESGWKPSSVAS